jgi:hypothetical protein
MQTQPGLEFKRASFPMLEKTHEAAEVFVTRVRQRDKATVHSVGQSTDGEKRKRHRRHLDDGSRAAGYRLHGYRQTQKRLALRLRHPGRTGSARTLL